MTRKKRIWDQGDVYEQVYEYDVKLGKVMLGENTKKRKKRGVINVSKKKGKKVVRSGHGKLKKGYYHRSDRPKHLAKYSVKKDLKKRASKLPSSPRKPFEGDDKKVLYNPKNPGQYIVLARYDRKKGRWVAVNYQGKATVAKKKNPRLRGWKVGYV